MSFFVVVLNHRRWASVFAIFPGQFSCFQQLMEDVLSCHSVGEAGVTLPPLVPRDDLAGVGGQ